MIFFGRMIRIESWRLESKLVCKSIYHYRNNNKNRWQLRCAERSIIDNQAKKKKKTHYLGFSCVFFIKRETSLANFEISFMVTKSVSFLSLPPPPHSHSHSHSIPPSGRPSSSPENIHILYLGLQRSWAKLPSVRTYPTGGGGGDGLVRCV